MAAQLKTTGRILLVAMLLTLVALTPAAAAPDRPAAEYASDSILVRFREDSPAAERAQARMAVSAERVREFALVPGLEHLRLAPGMNVERAMEILSRLPGVAYAEPDYIVHATVVPNDPSYGSLWGMANIHAPQAWDIYTGDPNFVVAIIDSGIDYNHPDLAANIWTNPGEIANNNIDDDGNGYVDDVHGWDFANNDKDPFDDNGHGTHTAGTVGAVGNNGLGVVGVNWQVKLMALKFLSAGGSGSTSAAVSALNYAVAKGVKVSNNSWGGGGYSQSLYDAISNARTNAGHIFAAAAGNGGSDGVGDNNDTTPFYPASYTLDNIISVAAITSSDAPASFSNYGATSVDLGAPGSSILSTVPGAGYESWGGTSMATPHVAGVAALLYGKNPTWTYSQVKNQILSTARPLSALAGKTVTGGTLDAAAALGGGTPPPSGKMHLGGLTGIGKSSGRSKWQATVTITVHANGNLPHTGVAGAVVTGAWSTSGSATCTTSSSGACTVTKTNLSTSRTTSITFTVTGITLASYTYDPTTNEVSTSVKVNRP